MPLSSVTDTTYLKTARRIFRRDKQTTHTITLELEQGKEEEARRRAAALETTVDLPEGVRFGQPPRGKSAAEDLRSLLLAAGLSIVFIYLLMGFLFESITLPLSIILTIPLASLGVYWGHFMASAYNIDFLGVVGLILLVGVVVNNGIVLIDYVTRLCATAFDTSATEALLTGGRAPLPADHDDCADHHRRPRCRVTLAGVVNSIGLSYHQLRPDADRRADHGDPADPTGGAGLLHAVRRSRCNRNVVAQSATIEGSGGDRGRYRHAGQPVTFSVGYPTRAPLLPALQLMTVAESFKAFVAGFASGRVHLPIGPITNQAGLTDEGAAQRDQVCFASLKHLFHETGRPQAADHDDRHVDLLLDSFGPCAEVALFVDAVDAGSPLGAVIPPAPQPLADLQSVPALGCDHLGSFQPFAEFQPARKPILDSQLDEQGIAVANVGAHGFEDLVVNTKTVLQRAAPVIVAAVGVWRQKLAE